MRTHLMIRASAGSGKTYQLAVRFLALLAVDRHPERILALTFTRKAAGEFTDRIFSRLAAAADDSDQATRLAAEIREAVLGTPEKDGLAPGWPEPLPATRDDFAALLRLLVGALDRLAMGTYDSFFVRIGRVHACELGLGSFHLLEEIEAEEEQDRIFRRIFSRLSSTADERAAFLQAFQEVTAGRAEIKLSDALGEFIKAHHQRYLACPDEEAWGSAERLWPEGDPWPVVGDWGKLAEALGREFPPGWWGDKRADGVMQKIQEWTSDYSPGKPKMPPLLERMVQSAYLLLREGRVQIKNYKEKWIEGGTAEVVGRLAGGLLGAEIRLQQGLTAGLWRLMHLYEGQYGDAVRRRGRVGFSDLTLILSEAGLGREGVGQTIGFRLDQRFDHWMLDEFQDTNRRQWEVVHGLLQEVQQDEDEGRTFFVVGDGKQAVHQWRGADPRLFDEIADDPAWQARMVEWSMDTSYRSAPAVLEMVNLVCDPTQPWMEARFPRQALARWPFHTHRSGETQTALEGCAQIIECPKKNSPDDEEDGPTASPALRALEALLDRIDPLGRGLSCGILVPTNTEADRIAEFLRSKNHLVEVDGEARAGQDSPVATALLDFFRWLQAPEDRLAWGHVSVSPLMGIVRGMYPAGDESDPGEAWLWTSLRRDLAGQGFGALVARLANQIEAGSWLDEFNRLRLRAWVREASRFDDRGGSPGDFVRWMSQWTQREHTRPGAIQVMTVHKSKGLEFDVVFLPTLSDRGFDNTQFLTVLEDRDRHGHLRFVLKAPNKAIIEADPALNQRYQAWIAAQSYEKFCQLYVAMTRARRGLYLIIPEAPASKKDDQRKPNFAEWIREAADAVGDRVPLEADGVTASVVHQTGAADWFERIPLATAPAPAPAASPKLPPLPSRRPRATPSGLKLSAEARRTNATRDRRGAMDFGSAVHAAFEAIGWLDDATPPPLPDDPDVRRVVERCLAAPAFRDLFRHPGGEVDPLREQAFDHIHDGKWLNGIMDRAHVSMENGHPISAVIIDFKTDAVEDARDLVERYHLQMEAYRAALAASLGLDPGRIRCLLASTRHGVVVEG